MCDTGIQGLVKVKNFWLSDYYLKIKDAVENLEIRDDDVWLCCFPKTGSTWTQEMIWCIANDLDFERAKIDLEVRCPFLDFSPFHDLQDEILKDAELNISEVFIDSIKFIQNMPSPRFIKTHMPYCLLPRQIRSGEKKPKIICTIRDPKDTCISFYHYSQLVGFSPVIDFEDFCRSFIEGKVCFSPFWENVLSYWNERNKGNIYFIKFEDMKNHLPSVIKRVADFLGKTMTDDAIAILEDHLSIEKMKVNPAVNNEKLVNLMRRFYKVKTNDGKFIRSGKTNQWKEMMSDDMITQFNSWTAEKLKNTDFNL